MSEVLVTGGTGLLGGLVVDALLAQGHAVRVLTRRPPPRGSADPGPAASYAIGDLRHRASLQAALNGVETVVHCATDPRHLQEVDVDGTARLVEAMAATGSGHLIDVSIVGIDRIPLRYYAAKREAERLVEDAAVGWTIQRATQFHQLLDTLVGGLSRSPLLPVPRGLRFQPVDPGDLARHLVRRVATGPGGRAPDFGGPEVLSAAELVRSWLAAHGRHRRVVPTPLPGRLGRALKAGANLCPGHADGTRTWQQYLDDQLDGRGALQPHRPS